MEEDYQYKFLSLLALYYFIHVRYSQQDEDSDLRPNDSVFIEYEDRNYASPVIIGYLESGRDTGTSLKFDSIE